MRHVELKVFGDVQGVGFRSFAYYQAHELGLVGSAENLPDGSVLIEAEGDEGKLKEFTSHLKRGPHFARVTKIEEKWGEPTGAFPTFRTR